MHFTSVTAASQKTACWDALRSCSLPPDLFSFFLIFNCVKTRITSFFFKWKNIYTWIWKSCKIWADCNATSQKKCMSFYPYWVCVRQDIANNFYYYKGTMALIFVFTSCMNKLQSSVSYRYCYLTRDELIEIFYSGEQTSDEGITVYIFYWVSF